MTTLFLKADAPKASIDSPTIMGQRPYRTKCTELTEDQLILLDVLFNGGAAYRLLRRSVFRGQWNLGYAHDLDDVELGHELNRLCEQGLLEIVSDESRSWFRTTPHGGALWSEERGAIWARYFESRQTETLSGRILMSVTAVSAQIRDDYLSLRAPPSSRVRTATITNHRYFVGWKRFPELFVGVVTYAFRTDLTHDESEEEYERLQIAELERSWWHSVSQLQRFLG